MDAREFNFGFRTPAPLEDLDRVHLSPMADPDRVLAPGLHLSLHSVAGCSTPAVLRSDPVFQMSRMRARAMTPGRVSVISAGTSKRVAAAAPGSMPRPRPGTPMHLSKIREERREPMAMPTRVDPQCHQRAYLTGWAAMHADADVDWLAPPVATSSSCDVSDHHLAADGRDHHSLLGVPLLHRCTDGGGRAAGGARSAPGWWRCLYQAAACVVFGKASTDTAAQIANVNRPRAKGLPRKLCFDR